MKIDSPGWAVKTFRAYVSIQLLITVQPWVRHLLSRVSCYIIHNRYKLDYLSNCFFPIIEYDMKSGVYSTWTESIWQTLSVRMFLKPSTATERFNLILGSLVTGFSFVLVWFINNKANVLFNSRYVSSF